MRTGSKIWLTAAGLVFFYLLLGLVVRYPLGQSPLPLSGDEHHYMTQAHSLLSDRNLVVEDNYEREEYRQFFSGTLTPDQWNLMGTDGYSGHSPGTGILVTPGWWLAGWAGVLATLAVTIGLAFAASAMTLARLAGQLSDRALLLLAGGFASLPILAFSHTLYPESIMILLTAVLALLIISHLQAIATHRRRITGMAAIGLAALAIGLHPKYLAMHLGVLVFVGGFELHDRAKRRPGASYASVGLYAAVSIALVTFFSWSHDAMWDTFHPMGWWPSVSYVFGVDGGRAVVQFVDLFLGSQLGLFVLVPLTMVSVAGLVRALTRGSSPDRRFTLFATILVGTIAGFAAFSEAWWGGDSPIGRYAAPLVSLLLIVGVHSAMAGPLSAARRAGMVVLLVLGLVQSVAYAAFPLAFKPGPAGAGILTIVAEKVPGMGEVGLWFWTAAAEVTPLSLAPWVLLLGLTVYWYGIPPRRRSGDATLIRDLPSGATVRDPSPAATSADKAE